MVDTTATDILNGFIVLCIILFPALGALINGLLSRRIKEISGIIASIAIGLSWILSIIVCFKVDYTSFSFPVYEWISSGNFHVEVGFLLDPLSKVMILVVTTVSFFIHVYSIGYMHGDKGYARYFCYLNLFVFSMLILVLADNYLLMFVGWEGVGLCSYLLIGFWYEKKSASDAGKKAFIVNRIGDFGFAIGLFLIFLTFGSLQFNEVFEKAHTTAVSTSTITAITLLLFLGAVGKSAQFPLYVWLPDAMEGPTPVSSLIHAATMVTAGVYMVARSNALYSLSEVSSQIVAGIGAFTAIFAASIALVNNDLKRILAYSTVSQLGYMFVGVGVGSYAAGIFHLMTHACFKGLMFLAAGSVMHALSGELDIRRMGGLKDKMKTTHLTFFIGALAIAGFPLLSGFWSKDEILYEAFARGHYIIWAVGLLTAFMTAFYMFRLIFMTFWGSSRVDRHVAEHLHESPKVMTIPLIVLAFLSVVAGWIGIGGHSSPFASFLGPVFEHVESGAAASAETTAPPAIIFMIVSAIVGIAGIFLAYSMYVKKPLTAERLARPQSSIHKLLYNKYYVDETYNSMVVNPVRNLSERVFWKFVDVRIVDGIVNGVAWIFNRASLVLRLIQSGYVQGYALAIIVGIVVILGYYLLR